MENASHKLRRLYEDFEGAMQSGFQNGFHFEVGTFSPRVDIAETKEAVHLYAELPGMNADDVKITISDSTLTLRGEKKRTQAGATASGAALGEGETFHRLERTFGEFVRHFALPDNLNDDAVEANFESGVLTVTIPKREPEPKEREVKIVAKN